MVQQKNQKIDAYQSLDYLKMRSLRSNHIYAIRPKWINP